MQLRNVGAAVAALVLVACGGGGSSAPADATSDLAIEAVSPSADVAGGTRTVLGLVVTNRGSDAASDVVVTTRLGAGLTVTGATCSAGGGANCPASVGPTTGIGGLPAGGRIELQVTVDVAPGASGDIATTASVSARNDAGKSGTAVVHAYSADVAVTGTGPTGLVVADTSATYTMTVTNAGPDTARDIAIADTLAAGQARVAAATP